MKNSILLLAGCIFSSIAIAQPIITSVSTPLQGNSFTETNVIIGTANEGLAGANQTWNFSFAIDTGSAVTLNFISPEGVFGANNFPTSNLVLQYTDIQGDGYVFLRNQSDKLEVMGISANTQGIEYVSTNLNPKTVYSFPVQFNSTESDTYRSVSNVNFQGALVNQKVSGSLTYQVDGYGTLITSSGTYNNVLRIKNTDNNTDSTDVTIAGFPVSSDVTTTSLVSYDYVYVQNGASYSLFNISTSTVTTADTIITTVSAVRRTPDINNSIKNNTPNTNFLLFPNPTEGKFIMNISGNPNEMQTVNVSDVSGRIAKIWNIGANPSNDIQEFDITELPSGIYFVSLANSSGITSKKIVKE